MVLLLPDLAVRNSGKFQLDRRNFLLVSFASVLAFRAASAARPTPIPETLTEWLSASLEARRAAVQACLERIRTMDPEIHAWVQVSPQKGIGRGKLSGIPFGVKDIIETRGLVTEYGSPLYKGRVSTTDAAIIRQMRQHGALLLGKTETAAFAYQTPAPTRNPRDLRHTPGGSSSGSAAAVAAGMVPIAIGEQTRGSILRPASFCGVVGFKATHGLLPMEGVLHFAKTQDTLGFFTPTARDMLALWDALGYPTGRAEDFALGVPDPLPEVDPPMAAAFQDSVARLRRAGASIRSIDIAEMLGKLAEASKTAMYYEGARFHKERFGQYGDRLGDLADLVREGLKIPDEQYQQEMSYVDSCKKRFQELFRATPVILTPAAPGPAPLGLESTGDPRMDAPWTALGTPSVSIPMPVSGLPLGLQLAALQGQDARLLQTAVRLEKMLAS